MHSDGVLGCKHFWSDGVSPDKWDETVFYRIVKPKFYVRLLFFKICGLLSPRRACKEREKEINKIICGNKELSTAQNLQGFD